MRERGRSWVPPLKCHMHNWSRPSIHRRVAQQKGHIKGQCPCLRWNTSQISRWRFFIFYSLLWSISIRLHGTWLSFTFEHYNVCCLYFKTWSLRCNRSWIHRVMLTPIGLLIHFLFKEAANMHRMVFRRLKPRSVYGPRGTKNSFEKNTMGGLSAHVEISPSYLFQQEPIIL